jgi:anti-sigma regulatory factor (Ser/Thr protein kinase)
VSRSSGPSLIHQVLLYQDAQQFLAAVLPFIRGGLDRDEPVLAVTTDVNAKMLRSELGPASDDVQFVDPIRWYDAPGRTMAACHRYVQERRDGHDRVRVVGEPVWAGWNALETAGWKRFEAGLNLAFAAAPAWMICSYDQRILPPEVVADARRTHPELSGGGPSAEYADPTGFCAEMQTDLPPPPDGRFLTTAFDGDPAPVRHFVSSHAATLGLSPRRLDDLVLAVNEVTTNAIRHGAGYGRARLWRDERYVLCDVFDSGQARNGLMGYLLPNPDSEGGHGLWITRQLCDLVEVRTAPSGTTVRLYIRAD